MANNNAVFSLPVPPKLIPFSFMDDQFYKGMRAHVVCAATQGDLPLSFTWLKDGVDVRTLPEISTKSYDGYSSTLSIESVTSKHSGNYTCVARNSAGSMQHTTQLSVHGKC